MVIPFPEGIARPSLWHWDCQGLSQTGRPQNCLSIDWCTKCLLVTICRMLDMASKDLFIFFLAAWVSAHRLIDLISESKLITSNTVEIRIFFSGACWDPNPSALVGTVVKPRRFLWIWSYWNGKVHLNFDKTPKSLHRAPLRSIWGTIKISWNIPTFDYGFLWDIYGFLWDVYGLFTGYQ